MLRDLVCLYSLLTQMVALKGSKNVSWSLTCGVLGRGDLHAARSYSLISPPRHDQRSCIPRGGPGTSDIAGLHRN